MTKLVSLFLVVPLLAGVSSTDKMMLAPNISGGTINFDFSNQSDLNHFAMYTSYYGMPHVNGDEIYSYIYAEQKVILKDTYFTNYLIEADFAPSVYNGHIDAGFYLVASNPGHPVDSITAYNLQIKHDPNVATWYLRIYRYVASKYDGLKVEVGNLPFWNSEWIHLSALVKDGTIYAYINNDYSSPILSYYVGNTYGEVGIRYFRCPAKVRRLSITAPEFVVNFDELNNLLIEYDSMNPSSYAPLSWSKYNQVCLNAKAQKTALQNQLEINALVKEIKQTKDELVEAKTYAELRSLIEECEKITDSSIYTANSFASFLFCLGRAKTLTNEATVDEISNEYKMLLDRKNSLIRYGGNS